MDQNKPVRSRSPTSAAKRFSSTMSAEHHSGGSSSPPSLKLQSNLSAFYHPSKSNWSQSDYPVTGGSLHLGSSPSSLPLDQLSSSGGARPKTQASETTRRELPIGGKPSVKEDSEGNPRKRSTLAFEILVKVQFTLSASDSNIPQKHTERIPVDYGGYIRWQLITTCPLLCSKAKKILESHNIGITVWRDRVSLTIRDNSVLQTNKLTQIILGVVDKLNKDTSVLQLTELSEDHMVYLTRKLNKSVSFTLKNLYFEVMDNTVYIAYYGKAAKCEVSDIVSHFKNTRNLDMPQTVSTCYTLPAHMEKVLLYFRVFENYQSQCQDVIWSAVNQNAQFIITLTGSKESVEEAWSLISHYIDTLTKFKQRIIFSINVSPATHVLFLEDVIQNHLVSKGFTCAVVQQAGEIYVYSDCGQEIQAATEAAKAISCKSVILTESWRERFDDLKESVKAHVKGPYILQFEAGARMNIIGYVPAVEEAEKVLKSILASEKSCKQSTQEGLASSTLTQQNEKNTVSVCYTLSAYIEKVLHYFNVLEKCQSQCQVVISTTVNHNAQIIIKMTGNQQSIDKAWSFISSYMDKLIKSEKRIYFNTDVLPATHILSLEDVIQYHLDSKGFTCAVVQRNGEIYVYSDCGQEIQAATEAAKAICYKSVILTRSWREKFDDLKQSVKAHVKGPYVLQFETGARMNIIGYVQAVEEAEKVLKSILASESSCKQSTQEGLASSTLTQQNEKIKVSSPNRKKLYMKHCESDKSKAETKSPETVKVHSYDLMSCPGDDRVWSFPEDRVLCLTLNAKENNAKVVVRLSMQMSDEAPFKCSKKSADGIRVELKLPRWKGGCNNESDEFKRMIEKTLAKTAEEKADSVMLMVDETFGWNKNWFLQSLIGPLVQHLRGKIQPKKIIMCVSGEYIFVEAVEEIQEQMGKQCTGEASASCGHLKVQVIEGSLHEIKADVLLNTTAASLDLKHGQLSSAILRAAGMEVQDECWKQFPNGLRLGEMAITKGYKLKCQKVFHGALPKFNHEKELESIQNLRTLVETCLCKANEYRFESIAFPAIGTGNLKYPVAYVASEMFGAVERFKMDHTQLSLRDVFFVIHPKDTSSLVHFKKIEKEMDKGAFERERTIPTGVNDPRAGVAGCPTEKPVRTKSPIQTAKQAIERIGTTLDEDEVSDQIAGRKPILASGTAKVIPSFIEDRDCLKCIFTKGFVVKIFTASILELSHMDTIVCSEDQSGKAAGMIAKALLKQGGVEYQREKAAAFKVPPPPGEIVTTRGGKSNFKTIIHALVPLRRDDTNIKSLYLKIFHEAITANSNKLAMSLLATGAGGQEVMLAGQILYNSCMEFCQNNPDGRLNVSVVNIDNYKTKDIVGVFKEFINQHPSDRPPMTSLSSWKQTGQPSTNPVTPPTTQKTKETELVDREMTSLRSHAGESSDDTDVVEVKKMCPTCGEVCGVILGDQPDGMLQVRKSTTPLAGHPGSGSISFCYVFPDGKQQAHHPSPGMEYKGTKRVAYLPDNDEGRKVAAMLIEAYKRRLVFTIGLSRTTGKDGVIKWNDIYHKTDLNPNTQFGYPDPSYLPRVTYELAAKGVTEKDLKQPFLLKLSKPIFEYDVMADSTETNWVE